MKKFSVSELTLVIKNLLERKFPDTIQVEGEISNFSKSSSGHIYFVLKDKYAQIRCAFFKRYNSLLKDYNPKNGDNVIVVGDLQVYEKDGSYQLIVKKIEYDRVGDFYKKFEEVKKKLESEGLFREGVKKKLPIIIKRVAVITSPNGAAIKDFFKTLKKNNTFIDIDLWPAPVQGEEAVGKIITNLVKLNNFSEVYDVVILMRGGGSLEDLAIFNDEKLARALFNCKIPTISAIGHERDFTICDFVADVRVSTPTAAAEKISEFYLLIFERIENIMLRLVKEIRYKSDMVSQYFDNLILKMESSSPLNYVFAKKRDVQILEVKIESLMKEKMKIADELVRSFDAVIHRRNPVAIISERYRKVEFLVNNLIHKVGNKSDRKSRDLEMILQRIRLYRFDKEIADKRLNIERNLKSLNKSIRQKIDDKYQKLNHMVNSLNMSNPENILKKGYAIVKKDSIPVESVKKIHLEDELEIRMKDGYITSFVTGKKSRRNE